MRRLALLTAAVVLAGCVSTPPTSFKRSPRLDRLEDLEKPEHAEDYESQWHAAMVANELADEDQEHREKSERKYFAKRGLEHAEKAVKLQPERVEGHFYRMVTLGRWLELSVPEPVLVADLRDEGERTVRIDERFECAGAHRFLGIFYSECPESGPYGYGDVEKADVHFQKALGLFPDCPETLIAYAKFQINRQENPAGARPLLEKALGSVDTHEGLSPEQRESFKKQIRSMLDKLPK